MTGDPRIRRPALARVAPRRNLADLLLPPAGGPAHPGGVASHPWTDVVSRSVQLGYRVIDDYVRQGEHAARTLGGTRFASDAFTAPYTPADVALRMTQSFADLATMWMGMLQMALPGSAPWGMPSAPPWSAWPSSAPHASSNGNGTAPYTAPHAAPPHTTPHTTVGGARTGSARLDVDLVTHAACRARVAVELWPEAAGRRLALDFLHGAGQARRIAVTIAAATATAVPTLRIHVPAEQPPGTYTGDVVDEDTAVPVGRVVLRLDPP